MSYTIGRYRQEPLDGDRAGGQEPVLEVQGSHGRAAIAPPGAGLRRVPARYRPVNQAAPDVSGLLARRTGLFVVAYAPLAAMFVVGRWPEGWSRPDILLLALWLAASASVLALPLAWSFVPAGLSRRVLAGAWIVAAATAALGATLGWHAPMGASQATWQTSAAAAGVAFGFCVVAGEIVLILLLTTRRSSTTSWKVRHPGEPGGAVLDYLVSYLFPVWVLWISPIEAYWVGPAVVAYLLVVFLAFVASRKFALVNPTLNLLGFRLYDVFLQMPGTAPRHVLLISRSPLASEARVQAMRVGGDCYVGRRPASSPAPG